MHLETIVVAISATVAITVQYIFHTMERKDLYSRIMARDLDDYRASTKDKTQSTMSKGNHIKKIQDKQYNLDRDKR